MSRLPSPATDERRRSNVALPASLCICDVSVAKKATRFALMAATSLWLAAAAIPSARAEVVFGNLGPDGTGGLNSSAPGITNPTGSATTVSRALAMGFITTSDPYLRNLSSVTLGLSNNTTNPATVNRSIAVYEDVGGVPGTTPFAVSNTVAVTGTTPALYTFTFGLETMRGNRKYWIVPSEGTAFRWYRDEAPSQDPVAFNGSGYTYAGALRKNNVNQWVTASAPNYSLSLAVIPVPESSALPLAGIGLVVGGWAARRRKRHMVAANSVLVDLDEPDDLG